MIDWSNIDLESSDIRLNILEPLNFDTFLLEISCNIKTENLNEQTLIKEFEDRLKMRQHEARLIFASNLRNILNKAIKDRA